MKRRMIFCGIIICSAFLGGCGATKKDEKPQVTITEYEKMSYETAEAQKGDIEPVLELKISADSYIRKSYYPKQDGMEVKQVYVENGDIVKKGDILVEFKAGDLGEQISQYEKRLEEDYLLIEHYTKLMEIDSAMDYSQDIDNLNKDVAVCKLYISELNARLQGYNIVAEDTGVVTIVSELLGYGIVDSNNNILSVVYGTGEYYTTTTDDYDFKVGDKYIATYGFSEFEFELFSIEEQGQDANGKDIRKLNFKMTTDGMPDSETLTMTINKPVIKDVLYVPNKAVFKVNDESFVYVVDEYGYRTARKVVTRDKVDEYTVIESGIEAGDRVVIN